MAGRNNVDGFAAVVDVEASEIASRKPQFSWLDPHPIFVIILVGIEEQPFGIQKDFLCAKSTYFRDLFGGNRQEQQIEHVVNLNGTPVEVFACAQNFLYTGEVYPTLESLPSYEILIGVWKLGHELGVEGLCEKTLESMSECRRITQRIPAAPLLVKVWQDTPEGSSIRQLFLQWAAEYMRSSDSRAAFARSLPQEVLSELVIAMSSLEQPSAAPALTPVSPPSAPCCVESPRSTWLPGPEVVEDAVAPPPKKKARHSDILPGGSTAAAAAATATAAAAAAAAAGQKPTAAAKKSRASLPAIKPAPGPKRRGVPLEYNFSREQKLEFCSDLLARMISGPGFWTRVVGPFKEPVDPVRDEVPDYLSKIKRPMDLTTIKGKMDRHEYGDENEFLADMQLIFTNCYTYWTKKDPMWAACERFERTFEEKYGAMNKWLSKMGGSEGL